MGIGSSLSDDVKQSLPVRSEADGSDAHVLIKLCDGTNPSTHQATVDSDHNLHTEIHGNDPTGADQIVRTSETGAITPDGVYNASSNTKPGNLGLIASSRSASTGDATQTKRLTSVTDTAGTVTALDVALHDQAGNAYSISNPMPVMVLDQVPGSQIFDYADTAAADIAIGASFSHDYTVTAGKTLQLTQLLASASGRVLITMTIDGVTLASMYNSVANPNVELSLKNYISVAATKVVNITITNLDESAFGACSTILGEEV